VFGAIWLHDKSKGGYKPVRNRGLSAESILRKLLPYYRPGWRFALVYVAWTFLSRWHDTRGLERAADHERARADAKIVEMYGSGNLKILHFYVTPGVILRGERASLLWCLEREDRCIDPAVELLKPSISRCLEISPSADTRYKLTATTSPDTAPRRQSWCA